MSMLRNEQMELGDIPTVVAQAASLKTERDPEEKTRANGLQPINTDLVSCSRLLEQTNGCPVHREQRKG